ncbi:MAG TPA: hypothetical protein VNZ22_09770, partial [Bacillota bacterium]|nr:hypothetical protein [Bacillota bacterium]
MVDIVQEERGLELVHQAEEDGGGDVFGAQRPGHEGGEDIQGGGFAAVAVGGREVQARAMQKRTRRMGMGAPEGQGIGSAGWQDQVAGETGGDLGEDIGAGDWFGPGFNVRQGQGAALDFVIELGLEAGDFAVEGVFADAQAFGFGIAEAVVLGGGEAGEALEGLFVGLDRGDGAV